MPIIDLLLDPVAFFEEFTIAWSQVIQDLGEGIPEILGIQPESRHDFFTNKRFQCRSMDKLPIVTRFSVFNWFMVIRDWSYGLLNGAMGKFSILAALVILT